MRDTLGTLKVSFIHRCPLATWPGSIRPLTSIAAGDEGVFVLSLHEYVQSIVVLVLFRVAQLRPETLTGRQGEREFKKG